jgi:hypothetical protein
MAVTGAIVAVVGLGVSVDAQNEQQDELVAQKRAKRATEFTKVQRERRAALREKRIRTAQLNVAAEATGVAGSSGELVTEAALSTNFAVNTGFQAGLQEASDVIGASQVRGAKAQVKEGIGQAVQSIGFQAFQANGGFTKG